MKSTLSILLLLSFFCSLGQPVIHPWYFKITTKIDQIQKVEFDSVASYIIINGSPSWGEEVKGLGTIYIRGEAILLGFKKNRISCIKIIESSSSVFKSKPIDLKADSILQNLRVQSLGIQSEIILPYIIEMSPDSISTIKGFYPVRSHLHAGFSAIYFKCSTSSDLKEFDPGSFNKENGHPPNLNFKYNNSLKSYKLYSFLFELITKYEKTFEFGK